MASPSLPYNSRALFIFSRVLILNPNSMEQSKHNSIKRQEKVSFLKSHGKQSTLNMVNNIYFILIYNNLAQHIIKFPKILWI